MPLPATVTIDPVALAAKLGVPPYEAVTVAAPAGRLDVVNAATPSTSVPVPITPFLPLKVTVPPFGTSPPGDRSPTVAVKVTDWPTAAEAVEARSAVEVGRAIDGPVATVAAARNGLPLG